MNHWKLWLIRSPCHWLLPILTMLIIFPKIDLTVSGWFFFEGEFSLRHNVLCEFIRAAVPPLMFGVALFVALLGVAAAVFRESFLGIRPRVAIYLLLSLGIGPGLLANSLFKDNWGRARPSSLIFFGGDRLFTPALVLSDQCNHNCSFVSGHAALAFWTIAFALLVPLPWRRSAIIMSLLYGFTVGLARVIQGRHFLSDVIFAAVLTTSVTYILHRLIIYRSSPF